MNDTYKVLKRQTFAKGNYRIVPIRMKDRHAIMQWRNEQIFHLRQEKPLTREGQDSYFETVVARLFNQEQPNQILFSYLVGDECMGYGGLVHMNWVDKNAEISFITKTSIEKEQYEFHMSTFLSMIAEVASDELDFHKIFTYTFDVRPDIYSILEKNGFEKEAELSEHCYFNGNFINVIIHAKFL